VQALTEARRAAVVSLDPSRTISSSSAIVADARKYLELLHGFRQVPTRRLGTSDACFFFGVLLFYLL
jgi:hypothetical protein